MTYQRNETPEPIAIGSKENCIRDILSRIWQPLYSDFGAIRGYLVHPSHVESLIQKLAKEVE